MPDLFQPFRLFLLHQGDAADAELIHWLKDRMDEILGVGPWAMVAATGAVVIAIPGGHRVVLLLPATAQRNSLTNFPLPHEREAHQVPSDKQAHIPAASARDSAASARARWSS